MNETVEAATFKTLPGHVWLNRGASVGSLYLSHRVFPVSVHSKVSKHMGILRSILCIESHA